MSADTATKVIVAICEHDQPIGARVDTEDRHATDWLKEELLAIHDGRNPHGRIEYWLRGLTFGFCTKCAGGRAL